MQSLCVAQDCSAKYSFINESAVEVCGAEVCTDESRPAEVRAEVCPGEIGKVEIRPGEIREVELRRSEIREVEVRLAKICPNQVRIAEVRPPEVRYAQV